MGDKEHSFRTFATGTKTVATAGTAVQLTATKTAMRLIHIHAYTGNSGNIVVGDSNVKAAAGSERGIILVPGASIWLRLRELSDIYIDAVTSNDGVSYTYFKD